MSALARVKFEPDGDNAITGKVYVNGRHIENVKEINYKVSAMSIPEVTLTLNGNYESEQLVALDVEVPSESETEVMKGLRFFLTVDDVLREHLADRIKEALIDGRELESDKQAEMILDYMAEEW